MSEVVSFPAIGLELNINRVAFSIGSVPVYWYGILIATGLFLAVLTALWLAPDFGLDADRLMDVVMVGTVCAVICARAYYVIFSPVPYESFAAMLDIRQGGLAIYGGVIGAAVVGALACKWRKLPLLPTFDLVGIGFFIGQCIGRWGNFFNQEAFGCNTTLPWGMYSAQTARYLASQQTVLAQQGVFVDPSAPVHPTFLYESLWCLAGLGLLLWQMKKRKFHGQLALLYVMWYGAGRFWIEGLRTDSLMLPVGGLRVSQLLALVSVVVAAVVFVLALRRSKGVQLMVELPAAQQARQCLSQAVQAHEKKLKAAGIALPELPLTQSLPANASHSQFAAAQAELKAFDGEAFVAQHLEMAAEMLESVRQENNRFAQLPNQEEHPTGKNCQLTAGLDADLDADLREELEEG